MRKIRNMSLQRKLRREKLFEDYDCIYGYKSNRKLF